MGATATTRNCPEIVTRQKETPMCSLSSRRSGCRAGFHRIAYLTYSRVEGRGKETPGKIALEFQPIAFVGLGQDVKGQMVRSNFVISWDGVDRDTARQYWIAADGTGRQWLAVQYDYARVARPSLR
jgi:hypothetical protein